MIIEIRKAGFINKGAELMLYSILEQVRKKYPQAKIVMSPTTEKGSQPFSKIVSKGMFLKANLRILGFQLGGLARLLPKRLLEMYGIILDKDVDVILDASGFDYSDQWGFKSSEELYQSSRKWKKNNQLVILLPQAFGPFNNKKVKHFARGFIKNVDLIFVRDKKSLDYVQSLVEKSQKIRYSRDFTNIFIPESNQDTKISKESDVAIVPNKRMIDKTVSSDSNDYIDFLARAILTVRKMGKKPFILVHEGTDDLNLALEISKIVGGHGDIEIVQVDDPSEIKRILGQCYATIGSRFHGIVSALSQGVPTLATGWSHKYEELYEDYDFKEGIITVDSSNSELNKKLELILAPELNKEIKTKLENKSRILKNETLQMWDAVFEKIDNHLAE